MNTQMQYSRVSQQVEEYDESQVEEAIINDDNYEVLPPAISDDISNDTRVLGSDNPNAFSRRPSKARDFIYAVVFFLHFILVSVLSGTEDVELHDSFNSWSSMIMVVTVLGSVIGVAAVVILSNDDLREPVLSHGIPLAIIFEICLGNILLLTKSRYSLVGVIVLIAAFMDLYSYKHARDNVSFTLALLKMVIDICKPYGLSLILAYASILVTQTSVLLWWGVLFVGLISKAPSGVSELLIVLMGISLYWTTQFFHSLMSFVVGGCVLWHFVREENMLEPKTRVLLHLHCGLTTSLGSICKSAALSPLAHAVLSLDHWAKGRPQSYVRACSLRGCIGTIVAPFISQAKRHHRLALCLVATYGRTLCKAAENQQKIHPEVIDIVTEDSSNYILSATAKEMAGLVALLFGVFVNRKEGASWPLFFFCCFILAYCGLSLALHIYNSAVDALIIVFTERPEKLAAENQIVFLRFLRTSEIALR